MSEKPSFKDANGRTISGHFVTVTAHNGGTATANLTDSMLTPETLARAILFQLHERTTEEEQRSPKTRHDVIGANIAKPPDLMRR